MLKGILNPERKEKNKKTIIMNTCETINPNRRIDTQKKKRKNQLLAKGEAR
jgi:hypothetical protein